MSNYGNMNPLNESIHGTTPTLQDQMKVVHRCSWAMYRSHHLPHTPSPYTDVSANNNNDWLSMTTVTSKHTGGRKLMTPW